MPESEPAEITPIDRTKLSNYDAAALTVARLNPSMTRNAIGTRLQEVGLSKDPATIYTRLKKNEYFKAEFSAVRKNLEQQLVRELAPLAVKNVRKHLKDKTLHARDQFPYNKLVLDKTTADRKDAHTDSPINIGHIERLQVLFQGTLLSDNGSDNTK
jgi:hypothetical protein